MVLDSVSAGASEVHGAVGGTCIQMIRSALPDIRGFFMAGYRSPSLCTERTRARPRTHTRTLQP